MSSMRPVVRLDTANPKPNGRLDTHGERVRETVGMKRTKDLLTQAGLRC